MSTHPIRFGLQTGQQNVEWNQLRELWRSADEWGYDSLWTFDHFYPIFVPDPSGPCLEGWTTLTALSQQTKRARIGAMVNGNTYRNPCITAKMAATCRRLGWFLRRRDRNRTEYSLEWSCRPHFRPVGHVFLPPVNRNLHDHLRGRLGIS